MNKQLQAELVELYQQYFDNDEEIRKLANDVKDRRMETVDINKSIKLNNKKTDLRVMILNKRSLLDKKQ